MKNLHVTIIILFISIDDNDTIKTKSMIIV